MQDLQFNITSIDRSTRARCGSIRTAHGEIKTPAFMPIGTQGCVKGLSPQDLEDAGVQIVLSNTYHLYLRPGIETLRHAGGLHSFAVWNRPVLTDSGGYQIFSLSNYRTISPAGVRFRSHLDGSYHQFTPELVVDLQRQIGSDIMMVLDECTPYPCEYEYAARSLDLTHQWEKRAFERFASTQPLYGKAQALFGIVQGSTYEDLRRESAQYVSELGFSGYAVGGLSVGEPKELMYNVTDLVVPLLPEWSPRYLMGVGKPEDLVECVALGIDLFDCVIPTRNARNGTVFTSEGPIVIKNARFKEDFRPIDEECPCDVCRTFSRAYVRHLFHAGEILVLRLATLHNVTFYCRLMSEMRSAIANGSFSSWRTSFYDRYRKEREAA